MRLMLLKCAQPAQRHILLDRTLLYFLADELADEGTPGRVGRRKERPGYGKRRVCEETRMFALGIRFQACAHASLAMVFGGSNTSSIRMLIPRVGTKFVPSLPGYLPFVHDDGAKEENIETRWCAETVPALHVARVRGPRALLYVVNRSPPTYETSYGRSTCTFVTNSQLLYQAVPTSEHLFENLRVSRK